MGFGYLLLGYLVTFVIYITASAVGIGSVALLLGYVLMLLGLWRLCRYQAAFAMAKWLTFPLLLTALYAGVKDLCTLLLWNDPFGKGVASVMEWASFLLIVVFHFAMLYGIRMIAMEVGLPKIATLATSNTLAVGLYAALYLVGSMPFVGESVRPYLTLSVTLFNLVFIISDLILLLQCAKNICAEGDEEVAPRPSRFGWINRIGDAYNRVHDELNEKSHADGEAFMQRKMEKQAQQQEQQQRPRTHSHKKKKKK